MIINEMIYFNLIVVWGFSQHNKYKDLINFISERTLFIMTFQVFLYSFRWFKPQKENVHWQITINIYG